MLEDRTHWFDAEWWQREIAAAISIEDDVLCNLRITLAHYQLSELLRQLIGNEAGANFHTWAVWGSKKAGETIRQEDTRRLQLLTILVTAIPGLALIAFGVSPARASILSLVLIGFGLLLAIVPTVWLRRVLNRTKRQILAGNIIVLEDIGNVSARFAQALHDRRLADDGAWERFAATLRPGRPEAGGQALLSRAFLCYHRARHESDIDKKHEHMFLGNCYAILHEHIRLQPYIHAAMPGPFRRLITARLLSFYLGQESLQVRADVPAGQLEPFPDTLKELDNPELIAFLEGMEGWDRTPNRLKDSHAEDWGELQDRMNFIVDLFRTRHLSPEISARPFTDAQEADLRAGRLPTGPF